MEAPKWFLKKLHEIDPSLRCQFICGHWNIMRLHNAPARGRKNNQPTRFLSHVGGGIYRPKETGIGVFEIIGPNNEYIPIDSCADFVLTALRHGNSWEHQEQETARVTEKKSEYKAQSNEKRADDACQYVGQVGLRLVKNNPMMDQGAHNDL